MLSVTVNVDLYLCYHSSQHNLVKQVLFFSFFSPEDIDTDPEKKFTQDNQ